MCFAATAARAAARSGTILTGAVGNSEGPRVLSSLMVGDVEIVEYQYGMELCGNAER